MNASKQNPVVLIHGYSARGDSFNIWKKILSERGYDNIHICSYRSLTNEVSIRDLAEGFDRALRICEGLKNDEPFDAIVHSTGMLVIRSWLTLYKGRRDRLKHLIGLAPASFGSPLAHKGRSWLGAIFKGNKDLWGPDFLEAGDRVLDGLELASQFTWELAHKDLLDKNEVYYGTDDTTPYVFVLAGIEGFSGITSIVNEPGTDGTVRWAGCSLNTRKITLDLTRDSQRSEAKNRFTFEPWPPNINIPWVPIAGINHQTILTNPSQEVVHLVDSALQVSSERDFKQWHDSAKKTTDLARKQLLENHQEWQQFIVRAVDERNDSISDFHLQLFTRDAKGKSMDLPEFEMDVHAYSRDASYRCFHVNLSEIKQRQLTNLWLRIIATSGSQVVGYHGFGSQKMTSDATTINPLGKWDAELEITALLDNEKVRFFYPFTTTFVELHLNREPLPIIGKNDVCWFLDLEWTEEAEQKLQAIPFFVRSAAQRYIEQFAHNTGLKQITLDIYKNALEKFGI